MINGAPRVKLRIHHKFEIFRVSELANLSAKIRTQIRNLRISAPEPAAILNGRICFAARGEAAVREGAALRLPVLFRTDESLAGGSNPGATSRGPTVSEIL